MDGLQEMARSVLEKARSKGMTIGCAESCTGGMIASALTSVPGSSDTFKGGVVSYQVEVKESLLGVERSVIEEHGVVSAQTALSMAKGACAALDCDIAVATTGIAGPGGAEPGKPVGTVWFAIHAPGFSEAFMTCKGASRDEVRREAVATALDRLGCALDGMKTS